MTTHFHELGLAPFPGPTGININMMPIVFGDHLTIPEPLRGYVPLVELTEFEPGTLAYLTITESVVEPGKREAEKKSRWQQMDRERKG